MKKLGIMCLILTVIVGSLFGHVQKADSKDKLVVTFWGGAVKAKAFEDSAAAYMEEFPDVTIELINVPSDYNAKVLSMMAAGTPPDVININSALTIELDGQLVDLTDKMQDLGYFDKESGLWPEWFTLLSSDGYYSEGEKLYQAPLGTGTTILAYNKRLFDAAGVAYPTADWTYEGEFLEAARKLSQAENQWGINGNDRGFIHHAIVAAYGGAFFDVDNLKFVGDSPETIRALQVLQDMIYKDGAHPTPAEREAFGGWVGMFESGAAAMYFLNTFEMPSIYDMEDWDIQFLPQGPKGSVAPIYGGRLAVLKSSKNKEHGWNFINLINGPVGQGFFSISSGFNNPPLQHVANTEAFRKGPPGAPENNWIRVDALDNAVVTDHILPNRGRINTILNDQLTLLWQNEITAEQAMSEAKKQIQPLLDEGY